jgi:hypothetical protein
MIHNVRVDPAIYLDLVRAADDAKMTIEEFEAALGELMGPDEHSRDPGHDGRRLERVEGGWRVINGSKYRARWSDEERRARLAELRQQGLTWPECAKRCGYSSPQKAEQAYGTWLKQAMKWEEKDWLRRQEMARLEFMTNETLRELVHYPALEEKKDGKVAPLPENLGPREKLYGRLLALHDRRVKLLGLPVAAEAETSEHHVATDVRIVSGSPADYVAGMLQLAGSGPHEVIEAMMELQEGPPQLSEEERLAHIERNRRDLIEVEDEGESDGVEGGTG